MEAAWWEARDNGSVHCLLCPTSCVIADGSSGACRIRTNRGGVLMADAWGEVVSLAIDPIEKKPLYHFHPDSVILSTGPNGCNFRCGYCQNSEISQHRAPTRHVEPAELVRIARGEGSIGVAYTYTEPFIWFEYLRDAGRAVRDAGLANVLVTNGYVNEEPLRELLPLVDAMNVDIKAMRPEFYRTVCGGRLNEVLRTVEIAAGECHIEVTNLIITGHNDTDEDFRLLVDWIAGIDPSIPVHFSRYFPRYRFTAPPTPPERLERACEIARKKLRYVYAGNISLCGTSGTHCPACGNLLIERSDYAVRISGIADGHCAKCGATAEVIGA